MALRVKVVPGDVNGALYNVPVAGQAGIDPFVEYLISVDAASVIVTVAAPVQVQVGDDPVQPPPLLLSRGVASVCV